MWEVAGFLDQNPDALRGFKERSGVIADVDEYAPLPNDLFVCAVGAPAVKRRLVEALLSKGAEFISLIHPSVVVGDFVQMGRGVVVCPGAVLTSDSVVGDFVAINCLSSVGHDVRIGAYTTISGHCDLTGNTHYGEAVFLGSGARVIPGKSVGNGAYVGAGSVVIRSVAADDQVFGNPARSIK